MTDSASEPGGGYPESEHEDRLRLAQQARREEAERHVDRELTDRVAERGGGESLIRGLLVLSKRTLTEIRRDSLDTESLAQWREHESRGAGVRAAAWGLPVLGPYLAATDNTVVLLNLARTAWGIGFIVERHGEGGASLVEPVTDLIAIIAMYHSNAAQRAVIDPLPSIAAEASGAVRPDTFASAVISRELGTPIDLAATIESVRRGQPDAVPGKLRTLLEDFVGRISQGRSIASVVSPLPVIGGIVGGVAGYRLSSGFSSVAEKYYRAKARLADRPGQP